MDLKSQTHYDLPMKDAKTPVKPKIVEFSQQIKNNLTIIMNFIHIRRF